jgi:hypothetical protein
VGQHDYRWIVPRPGDTATRRRRCPLRGR